MQAVIAAAVQAALAPISSQLKGLQSEFAAIRDADMEPEDDLEDADLDPEDASGANASAAAPKTRRLIMKIKK